MKKENDMMKFWMRLLYSVAGFLDSMIALAVTVEKILAHLAA